MDPLVNSDRLLTAFLAIRDFLQTYITTEANLLQMPAIFITLFFAWTAARLLDPWLGRIAHNVAVDDYQEAFYAQHIIPLSLPAFWVAALWLSMTIADQFGWPVHLVSIALQLAAVWLLIRFASALIPNAMVAKVVAVVAWTIAALNVLGVLTPTIVLLQKISFTLGSSRTLVADDRRRRGDAGDLAVDIFRGGALLGAAHRGRGASHDDIPRAVRQAYSIASDRHGFRFRAGDDRH